MLQMTIREMIQDRTIYDEDYRLYSVMEGDIVFYIGQSSSPRNRLYSHLGLDWHKDPSPLGKLILRNKPHSGNWVFTQYTLEECLPLLGRAQPINPRHTNSWVKGVEECLIHLYKPCLNTAVNPDPTPLPEKYRYHETPEEKAAREDLANKMANAFSLDD